MVVTADGTAWYPLSYQVRHVLANGDFKDFDAPSWVWAEQIGHPWGLTVGPDGNVWYTAGQLGQFGRVASDGQITMFPPVSSDDLELYAGSPRAERYKAALVAGRNYLWFASDILGRVAVDGTITEFNLTGPPAVTGLVSAADGMWFGAEGHLERITDDGEITERAIPSGASPESLMAGLDGGVWFTAPDEAGYVTDDGRVIEFPVPSGGMKVTPLGVDVNRNLWLVKQTTLAADQAASERELLRVNLDGCIVHFPLAPSDRQFGADNISFPARPFITTDHQSFVFHDAPPPPPPQSLSPLSAWIGRATPLGDFSERSFPLEGQLWFSALSPDSSLWLFEDAGPIQYVDHLKFAE